MKSVQDVLGREGLLAQRLPGFRFRRQQLEMAEAVASRIEQGGVLITEAGTGTGKTFAYLVPVLLSGRKVTISTGTKNLQDQLFHRDLPLIKEILGLPVTVALLKGRSNYLCVHRLARVQSDGRSQRRAVQQDLAEIADWARRTRSGETAELTTVSESAAVWPLVTSTGDNCLGQECPDYAVCHLVEARRRAQEADVVVVNHHLLCADLALKEEGFGELLPGSDCFVVDEAHQLPEVAGNFFGVSVSGRQLLDLARDIETEYLREAGDLPELLERAASFAKTVQDLRLAFGLNPRRGSWSQLEGEREVMAALEQVRDRLQEMHATLESMSGRGKGLDSCCGRCSAITDDLDQICLQESAGSVRWFETQRLGFRLNSTPLEIAEVFRPPMQRHAASWIFTSATLAVGESFEHFSTQLGIEEAQTGCWDSPFDYPHQALLFVPTGMPDPRDADYHRAVCELALPILEASGGRAFLLFTSHRGLQLAARFIAERLGYPLLVQGRAPRSELLGQFRELGNAVLLGTASFWEGVDVRGSALSCVIIDKLPFAAPDEPLLQARIDALRARGGNPFMQYQVPRAAIALKQGAGRLIRDERDRGVLVICDPRLLTRPYGRVFLRSLPPMARTRSLPEVCRFFAETVID